MAHEWSTTMGSSLREQFDRDGFVAFPDAFSASLMDLAQACWEWSMEAPRKLALQIMHDGSSEVAQRVAGLEHADRTHTAGLSYNAIGSYYANIEEGRPVLDPLLEHPSLARVLSELIAGERAWFLGEQVFYKEPEAAATGWHQDISDMSANGPELVVLWIPFDPVDTETTLAVAKATHKGEVFTSAHGSYVGQDIPDVDARPDEFDVVREPCRRGDVLAFHMASIHGGGPTKRGQTRRAMALRFAGASTYYQSRTVPNHPSNGSQYDLHNLKSIALA